MVSRRVTILGAGNGGRAAAAEFALGGHAVTLYEIPALASSLDGIAASGSITATGVLSGTAPVRVELDLEQAIVEAEILLAVVPTMYQRAFAEMLAPHVRDGMNLVLMPGSMGSLDVSEYWRTHGVSADVTVSEIAALPYATRITGPDSVHIFGRRRIVSIGVFPAEKAYRVMPAMSELYPGIEQMANVLEAGLNNHKQNLHCLGVLLSASRIEYSHGEFYY